MTPDLVNALFEALGAIFLLRHCWVLWKSKQARGVSLISTIFFASWGLWNIYYYPHLEQWYSFSAGLAIVSANCLWIWLIIYIRSQE